MGVQHKYDEARTVTYNTVRVRNIVQKPNTQDGKGSKGVIKINYEIGEEVDGVFTKHEDATCQVPIVDLPGAFVNALRIVESCALRYGTQQNLYPSGTEEPAT